MTRREIQELRRLVPYVRPEWRRLALALILMMAGVLLQLALPLITRQIIDSILPHKNFVALNWVIVFLCGFMVFKGICDILQAYVLTSTREKILLRLQIELFRHVQSLSLAFFRNSNTGYLLARINNDIANVGGLLSRVLLGVLKDTTTFVIGAAFILWFDWRLAVAALLVLPFFIASLRLFSAPIKRCSGQYQEMFALVWAAIQESLSAIHIVKSYQTETIEEQRVVNALRRRVEAVVRMTLLSSVSGFATAFVGGVGPLVVLWYGGREVIGGRLTLGTLIAFNVFLGYLFGPAQSLMNLNTEVQTSMASLERVSELFETVPEVKDPVEPKRWINVRGGIEFRDVTFGYDSAKPVLRGVNLVASAGQAVAIVGRSGVGKTTLVSLIPRFFDPQNGSIFVDGIDIRQLKQSDLRRAISIVPQEVFLFSGSIRDNIRYARQDATPKEVERVAALAHAADFIRNLPRGFETEVGERGIKLSGGERQRIAIARAMLRKPKILILDEATSEIDCESERLIQEAMTAWREERTTFIIAHRFATLLNADKIVVLGAGRIVAEGSHYELYAGCPDYHQLCIDQFITGETDPTRAEKWLDGIHRVATLPSSRERQATPV